MIWSYEHSFKHSYSEEIYMWFCSVFKKQTNEQKTNKEKETTGIRTELESY